MWRASFLPFSNLEILTAKSGTSNSDWHLALYDTVAGLEVVWALKALLCSHQYSCQIHRSPCGSQSSIQPDWQ